MKTIYKYPYPVNFDGYTIKLPRCPIVDFQAQDDGNGFYFWALVDTNDEKIDRYLRIIGTGQEIPEGWFYHKTVHVDGFVWHLIEKH